MPSFNKVILMGNLGADPELKQTQTGVSVTNFRIAVTRRPGKNQENPQTDWITVVCWRQTAEFVAKYFTKGSPILVCGSLQTREWTDQNGQKRYATEVVADEVSFVGKKQDSAAAGGFNSAPAPYSASPQDAAFQEMSSDDDLPF